MRRGREFVGARGGVPCSQVGNGFGFKPGLFMLMEEKI